MEYWRRISARGSTLSERQEWIIQYGYEGHIRRCRLPKLVVPDTCAGDEGLWCDWRELFNTYFAQQVEVSIETAAGGVKLQYG
jgi:hypothetical protein